MEFKILKVNILEVKIWGIKTLGVNILRLRKSGFKKLGDENWELKIGKISGVEILGVETSGG